MNYVCIYKRALYAQNIAICRYLINAINYDMCSIGIGYTILRLDFECNDLLVFENVLLHCL